MCYPFLSGGDFILNHDPQGNQAVCQMNKFIPEGVDAMRTAINETCISKLFFMPRDGIFALLACPSILGGVLHGHERGRPFGDLEAPSIGGASSFTGPEKNTDVARIPSSRTATWR